MRWGTVGVVVGVAACVVGAGYLINRASNERDVRVVAICLALALLFTVLQITHQVRQGASSRNEGGHLAGRRHAIFRTYGYGWFWRLLVSVILGFLVILRWNGASMIGWAPVTESDRIRGLLILVAVVTPCLFISAITRYRQFQANYVKMTRHHLVCSWQEPPSYRWKDHLRRPHRFTVLWADVASIWRYDGGLVIDLAQSVPSKTKLFEFGETLEDYRKVGWEKSNSRRRVLLLSSKEIRDPVKLHRALVRLAGSKYLQEHQPRGLGL